MGWIVDVLNGSSGVLATCLAQWFLVSKTFDATGRVGILCIVAAWNMACVFCSSRDSTTHWSTALVFESVFFKSWRSVFHSPVDHHGTCWRPSDAPPGWTHRRRGRLRLSADPSWSRCRRRGGDRERRQRRLRRMSSLVRRCNSRTTPYDDDDATAAVVYSSCCSACNG